MKLDIREMAKAAGFIAGVGERHNRIYTEDMADEISAELRRFAELVEAVTREDDALTLDYIARRHWDAGFGLESDVARGCAAAIRALKSA